MSMYIYRPHGNGVLDNVERPSGEAAATTCVDTSAPAWHLCSTVLTVCAFIVYCDLSQVSSRSVTAAAAATQRGHRHQAAVGFGASVRPRRLAVAGDDFPAAAQHPRGRRALVQPCVGAGGRRQRARTAAGYGAASRGGSRHRPLLTPAGAQSLHDFRCPPLVSSRCARCSITISRAAAAAVLQTMTCSVSSGQCLSCPDARTRRSDTALYIALEPT